MGAKRQDCRALVQPCGFLQIAHGLLEPTLLRVRHPLEGKDEAVIGFQLQSLSSELNRLIEPPRRHHKTRSIRVGPR